MEERDQARGAGDRLSPVSRAGARFIIWILGLAPQALCSRPLRGLALGVTAFRSSVAGYFSV